MEPARKQAICQSLSASSTYTAAGNTGTMQFVVPDGYSRLTGIYFDPAKNLSVVLTSQKANKNILNGFSTMIGTALGYLPLKTNALENDIIILQWTALTAAVAANTPLTFSLMFE